MTMYDEKCEELADYFLKDEDDMPQNAKADLAQHIQDAIEDWLGSHQK